MNYRKIGALFFPLTMSLAAIGTAAQAGTLVNAEWVSTSCGAAPAVLKLDLSNPDAYNRSVDGINTYRKANRAYLDCVVKEANTDIQSVTKAAQAVQQAGQEADAKILADVKAADKKFGGK